MKKVVLYSKMYLQKENVYKLVCTFVCQHFHCWNVVARKSFELILMRVFRYDAMHSRNVCITENVHFLKEHIYAKRQDALFPLHRITQFPEKWASPHTNLSIYI